MTSFAPAVGSKRKASTLVESKGPFFPNISKIKYDPNAAADDVMTFKYYNADEKIMGKTMAEWCKFAVCYWHTFRGTGADPFGAPTFTREWDDGTDSLENAERRLRVAFEFMSKLGVPYWCFHDRDIAPEGATLEETNANLDRIVDLAEQLMKETGIKLLWGTANLFSHKRYMNGAGTNPDAHTYAYAAAQVKKAMEVTARLGGEGYVFWGGREGYMTLLNTDIKRESDHMATFFKMAVAHKKKLGWNGQLLIEPKPKEPSTHQYDYDSQSVMAFLRTYGLEDHFKVNVEPNHTTLAGHNYCHDLQWASSFGFLGSIDTNSGTEGLQWDTDQFPMDIKQTTWLMKIVLEQGGLPCGLNFDAKPRRESTRVEDLFIAHIGGIDSLARGLRNAAKLIQDATMSKMVSDRYSTFDSGFGAQVEKGEVTFEDCEAFVLKSGEPAQHSGRQETYESILNRYV